MTRAPRPLAISSMTGSRRIRSAFGVISIGQVAVAEVPGDPHQRQRVGGSDLGERLGRGDHLDDAAVLEPQAVAAAQHGGFGEVEQEGETADAGHDEPAAIAFVEFEHHGVDGRPRPVARR